MSTHYEVLGLSPDASEGDVKSAYRRLALQHHPDKGGSQADFVRIADAYTVLVDASKRAAYDAELAGGSGAHGGGGGGYGSGGGAFGGGFSHPFHERPDSFAEAVFRSFFGGDDPFRGFASGGGGGGLRHGQSPFGPLMGSPFSLFGDMGMGGFGGMGAFGALGAGGGGFSTMSSSSSSWRSNGESRSVQSSTTWEGGVRVTRTSTTVRRGSGEGVMRG